MKKVVHFEVHFVILYSKTELLTLTVILFFMHFTYDILYFGLKITQIEVSHLYFS